MLRRAAFDGDLVRRLRDSREAERVDAGIEQRRQLAPGHGEVLHDALVHVVRTRRREAAIVGIDRRIRMAVHVLRFAWTDGDFDQLDVIVLIANGVIGRRRGRR